MISAPGRHWSEPEHEYTAEPSGKDLDFVLFPNRGHGFGNEPYMMRQRGDYFVTHLMGAEPPKEYELGQAGR